MWKGVATLAKTNLLAQIVVLAVTPVVTRIYSPEVFGQFAAFLAVLMTVIPVACLRLDVAIVSQESDEEATCCAYLAFIVAIGLAALVATGGALAGWYGVHPMAASFLPFVGGFVLLLGGIKLILHFSALRVRKYPAVGGANVSEAVLAGASRIGLGALYKADLNALLLSKVIGDVAFIHMLRHHLKGLIQHRGVINRALVRRVLQRNIQYVRFSSPGILLNSASRELITIVVAVFFGAAWAGQYAVASRVLRLPNMSVGKALSNVYLSESAKQDTSEIRRNSLEMLQVASLAMVPGFCLLAVVADWMFPFVFGEGWGGAGDIVIAMFYFFAVLTCLSPVLELVNVLNMQRLYLATNAALVVVIMILAALLSRLDIGILPALSLIAVSASCVYGVTAALLMKRVGASVWEFMMSLLPGVTVGAMILLLAQMPARYPHSLAVTLGGGTIMVGGAIAYAVLSLRRTRKEGRAEG